MSRSKKQQDAIDRLAGLRGKKPGPKPKKDERKDHDLYDRLSEEEQDKFWDETGRLKFKEITGEPTYPQFVIDRAFELFIDGLTLEEIAIKWDISTQTINNWSTKYNWQKKAEKILNTIEAKVTASKVKTVVTKRQELDKKHESMITRLQWEVHSVIDEPVVADPAIRKMQELSKINRMKVLKLATDCYMALIDKERAIAGINNEDIQSASLPTDFTFNIVSSDGISLDDEGLINELPLQTPHEYLPGGVDPNLLPEHTQTGEELKMIEVEAKEAPKSGQIDPITVAKKYASAQPIEEKKRPQTDHPLGYLGGQMGINPYGY